MRSHSRDPANDRSAELDPGRRCPQLAAVFTKSGLYIRTLRRTLTTRVVRAPRLGCGRSWGLILGSIAGYPWIHALRRVGTPSAAVEPSASGTSCQRMKDSRRCSVAIVARK